MHLASSLCPTVSSVKAEPLGSLFSTKDSAQQSVQPMLCCLLKVVILNLNLRGLREGDCCPPISGVASHRLPDESGYEPVIRKIVFCGKNISEFLLNAFKCFAGSLLYLFSILPGRDFLNVSDLYHKMEFIFLIFWGGVYLKTCSLCSFREIFLMAITYKVLTQKVFLSCCTVCLYRAE